MRSIAFLAAALFAVAEAFPENPVQARQDKIIAVQQPIEDAVLDKPTQQGCFKSAGNNMTLITTIKFNAIGACAGKVCLDKGFTAAASSGGNQCWCGNKYPPERDLVEDKYCNVGCSGYGEHACGGKNYFSVYNTGKTLDVDFAEDSGPTGDKHKETTTSSTTAPTQVVTLPPSVVTQTPTQAPSEEENKGGKNVAGIVAGVVVGVIAAAGLATGAYLYLRRKRNKEIEEEHRRNAAVSAFIGKPPGSSRGSGLSGADSRMDPVMAQRRMSDGSIADNEDYSRKILRVTNA